MLLEYFFLLKIEEMLSRNPLNNSRMIQKRFYCCSFSITELLIILIQIVSFFFCFLFSFEGLVLFLFFTLFRLAV